MSPVLIFKYVYETQEFGDALPPGSDVHMNRKSSYISTDLFIKRITQHFLKHKLSVKVILLSDGHTAHCRLSHTVCSTCYDEAAGVDQKQVFGAFAKFRKATINFKTVTGCLFLLPSVHMEQLGSHWTDFHDILYLNIFRKSLEKIQVPLKSEKNNVRVLYMTTDTHCDQISLNSS
jgi:hypothetical protein